MPPLIRNPAARRSLPALLVALSVLACCRGEEAATLLLTGGRVVTMDPANPEAEAVAIRGDAIAAVGTNEEIGRYRGKDTEVMDLGGRLAIPGFIDGHAHFLGLGRSKQRLDLTRASSWEEIVSIVERAAMDAEPGRWILGRGWHQEKWSEAPRPNVDGLPFHGALSAVSPRNPVLLTHASGHSLVANERAMEIAGITARIPDPEGGEIVRDGAGEPAGVFREKAKDLLTSTYERWEKSRTADERRKDKIEAIRLAEAECIRHGVTSFQDAGAELETVDLYRELAEAGELKIRLYVMLCDSNSVLEGRLADYRVIGAGQNHLTVRAIKRWIDGALGSHGAWLLEPYEDLPESAGLNTESIPAMRETARLALESGFQLCTHAIGDRANRATLDIYEEALRGRPDGGGLRWRIEHAQHLHPDDVPRFAGLGVIASMQGVHCVSDGPWVAKRIGEERARTGAYVWRKLLDSGAIVSNGTDAPVEGLNPIPGFHALVARRLADGSVFHGEERMTREEALLACTRNAAYAAFEEEIKGSIAPGKLADIAVLSRDILTVPEEEILGTVVWTTIVGGEVLHGRPR
ncbi:MAG: amidohydrolase [Candidatus Eisenbacteria bacterium]